MIPTKVYDLFIGVLPLMILCTVVIISLRLTVIIYSHEDFILHNEIKKLFYILYVFALFILVTSTDFESYSNNFIPFREITRYSITSKLFYRNVVGNILLFLPFGYLITDVIKSKTHKCNILIPFLLSLVTSSTIEMIQMFIGRSFDIDDIILNVMGGLVGYIIYEIFHLIINPLKKKGNESIVVFISALIIIGVFLLLCFICYKNGVLL